MEDEGNHGNDDTRCFILSTLAALQWSRVTCVLCRAAMLVFDRYPLVDGTFFLSPRQHSSACAEVRLGRLLRIEIYLVNVETRLLQRLGSSAQPPRLAIVTRHNRLMDRIYIRRILNSELYRVVESMIRVSREKERLGHARRRRRLTLRNLGAFPSTVE